MQKNSMQDCKGTSQIYKNINSETTSDKISKPNENENKMKMLGKQ